MREETVFGYVLLLPALVIFGVFSYYPIARAFHISLLDWDGISKTPAFVGLDNYARALIDPLFRRAFRQTIYYMLGVVPGTMLTGLFLAVLLNTKFKGRAFFRTIYYLPNVAPTVAASVIWKLILDGNWGLMNFALKKVGLPAPNWLFDPQWAMVAIIIMGIWANAGYQMVIFLAGLQGIPDVYYEAARMDGAGRWQQFRFVTMPLLSYTTFFVLITSVIGSFQVFGSIYILTNGGPVQSTIVMVFLIYQRAFKYFQMGYGSALAYVLFAIVLLLTLFQFWVGRKLVYYEV
ncbi:MAG: sugar ABC transporter permease [Anaerolineales bacterium]|nr:sugar ABC transporter permease [Anaerolineales bacterium]